MSSSEEFSSVSSPSSNYSESESEYEKDAIEFKPVISKSLSRPKKPPHAKKTKRAEQGLMEEVPDKEFGGFEKFTKGFGMKMLKKMGYVPGQGLGAKGQGIVNPIDLKSRPKQMGMGYKGFEERERESSAESESEAVERVKKKNQGWKKRPQKKTAVIKVETVEESIVNHVPVKIIDMTGPVARQISSYSEIRLKSGLKKRDGTVAPELRYNLSLIVDNMQSRLSETERIVSSSEAQIKSLDLRLSELGSSIIELDQEIGKCSRLKQTLSNCLSKSQSVSQLSHLSDLFYDLAITSRSEYEHYGLDSFAMGIIAKSWKSIVSGWNPFEQPKLELDTILAWTSSWIKVDKVDHMAVKERSSSPYENLILSVWVPPVRTALCDEDWRFDLDSHLAIDFLRLWQPCIPQFVFHVVIIDQIVLPRLLEEIERWNPLVDDPSSIPLDIWLVEWLPLVGEKLFPVYINIRHQLQKVLQDWDPLEISGLDIVQPWRKILPSTEVQTLCQRCILPKLAMAFNEYLVIDPSHQSMDAFNAVIRWSDVIQLDSMCMLFETYFFPKWHRALYDWMTSEEVDYDEVIQWLEAWKSIIPNQQDPLISRQLKVGLDMINQLVVNPKLSFDQFVGGEKKREKEGNFKVQDSRPAKVHITFKEIVERMAAEHQLTFISTEKSHPRSGRLIYRLGSRVLVWLDGEVAFVYQDGNDIPMSLEDLMSFSS